MSGSVDDRLFKDLAAKDGAAMGEIPGCSYDKENRLYRVQAWGQEYLVQPLEKAIQTDSSSSATHQYFYVFLVNYLLGNPPETIAGQWVSEKDLPGGPTFFRGPHEIPTRSIADVYVNDMDRLSDRCKALGGEELDMADLSFRFKVMDTVHLALLYWQGDEDFPPEAKLLMDSSLMNVFALDVVYALLCDACNRIALVAE